MIAIYKKPTKAELRKWVKDAIKQIEAWFKANPDRDMCRTSLWYSEVVEVRRDHVKEDIGNAAKKVETI